MGSLTPGHLGPDRLDVRTPLRPPLQGRRWGSGEEGAGLEMRLVDTGGGQLGPRCSWAPPGCVPFRGGAVWGGKSSRLSS